MDPPTSWPFSNVAAPAPEPPARQPKPHNQTARSGNLFGMGTDGGSVFTQVPEAQWIAANDLAFAIRDSYPVSPGHSLIIPRRPVATWDTTTAAEREALLALMSQVKDQLRDELNPDGFNVGFNEGAAAGQTVFHLHIHVIPRFTGDVRDPRGGIRHAVMGKGIWEAP